LYVPLSLRCETEGKVGFYNPRTDDHGATPAHHAANLRHQPSLATPSTRCSTQTTAKTHAPLWVSSVPINQCRPAFIILVVPSFSSRDHRQYSNLRALAMASLAKTTSHPLNLHPWHRNAAPPLPPMTVAGATPA
ncbi:hypothetical protein U1Q18_050155, partial [Sarracenia purpurea var. burkii]